MVILKPLSVCGPQPIPKTLLDVLRHAAFFALLTNGVLTCVAESTIPPGRSLTIHLVDADTDRPVSGVVRITQTSDGRPLKLRELIERENGWHTTQPVATVTVPDSRLTIEALRGLQTETARVEVDVSQTSDVTLRLKRFYNARERGWRNANTHLHIMKRSRVEAERYLREVPEADGLELVFLSHLRRIPDETTDVSNQIVEAGLSGNALRNLSTDRVLFRPGEEHRHNFGRGGEGFGHVMLLNIVKLIRPVSIGPGIMRSGSDAMPLQRGIQEARADGATVVWCHNANGFEDIPNWMSGTLHAQNIFDGGNHSSPIYFEFQGNRVFKPEVALELIREIEESLQVIREKAVFASDAEDQAVMKVYRDGIRILQERMAAHASGRKRPPQ